MVQELKSTNPPLSRALYPPRALMSPRGTPKTNFDFCLEITAAKLSSKSPQSSHFLSAKTQRLPLKGRLKHQTPNKKAEDLASSAVFARFSPSPAIAVVGECKKRNRSCICDYGFLLFGVFSVLCLWTKFVDAKFAAKKLKEIMIKTS